MQVITQEDLDGWGVTVYEALEAARENLKQWQMAFVGPEEGPGTYISALRDNYEASRLLLIDLIQRIEVKGDPVAMIPNRDMLIITGSDDPEGLVAMAKLAEKALQEPRPISGIPVRLKGEEWVTWLPPGDHPSHQQLNRLRIQDEGQDYASQKKLLDALHRKTGEDIFVASYGALQDQTSGQMFSYAVWAKDVLTLLPKADKVAFMRRRSRLGELA